MALPLAHAAAGYLVHRLDGRRTRFDGWKRALAFMAIGNLPDFDFVVGFVMGSPGAFHRGVSHTVLAAVLFGIAAGALCRRGLGDRWLPAALAFGAAYASHLLLDALTADARGPAGAQFFWPLSNAYYIAPVTLFSEITIDGSSRGGFLTTVLAWPTMGVLIRETAIAAIALISLTLVEGWARSREGAPAVALGMGEPGEEDLA